MTPVAWKMEDKFPENLWIGVSVENQKAADERIPYLLRIPAAVRFLSVEPMIGPVDLRNVDDDGMGYQDALKGLTFCAGKDEPALGHKIDWVICGGESGAGNRPMDPAWARDLRDQCKETGTAFFCKQMGGERDKKEGFYDLPEDLRIRIFPR